MELTSSTLQISSGSSPPHWFTLNDPGGFPAREENPGERERQRLSSDCHRTSNGACNPLERVAAVRKTFFPRPGATLGAPMKVDCQARAGYPENIDFRMTDFSFTAVDIPGSNNFLVPWSGLGKTTPTPEQTAEVQSRTRADIRQLTDTFQAARRHRDRAVVVMTPADMFDPTVTNPAPSDYAGCTPLVNTRIGQANAFGGPVCLSNGDRHVFNEEHPLASGSPWLAFCGQSTAATDLTRLAIDVSSNAHHGLKATETPRGSATPLVFERVPFTHPATGAQPAGCHELGSTSGAQPAPGLRSADTAPPPRVVRGSSTNAGKVDPVHRSRRARLPVAAKKRVGGRSEHRAGHRAEHKAEHKAAIGGSPSP